jgi:polyisoprenyl-phosphate glycosyltransferase
LDTERSVTERPRYSIVVPVFNNRNSLEALVADLELMTARLGGSLEVIFVVDGGDRTCADVLRELTRRVPFVSVVVELTRNFGSFAAIRTGLGVARGDVVAVRSADLQEPGSLVVTLLESVRSGPHELAIGVRRGRDDPFHRRFGARVFWGLYCRLIQKQMPRGGVDTFACSARVNSELLRLQESNSSLVGLLVWLGFEFTVVPYDRAKSQEGKSGWSLRRLIGYAADSSFAFGQLPIRIIRTSGLCGILGGLVGAIVIVAFRITGYIDQVGYTPLMLAILTMGSVNLVALSVVGSYAWRGFENSKHRPSAVIERVSVLSEPGGSA